MENREPIDQTEWQATAWQAPRAEYRGETLERREVTTAADWEFRSWTTYTAPAWLLLVAIAISLLGMLRIVIMYKRARRRRIKRWNRPRHRLQ